MKLVRLPLKMNLPKPSIQCVGYMGSLGGSGNKNPRIDGSIPPPASPPNPLPSSIFKQLASAEALPKYISPLAKDARASPKCHYAGYIPTL
jgi:hypothetical protein